MTFITAILVSVLCFSGIFLILQKNFVRVLFGFALLNHTANLFVLSVAGEPNESMPILQDGISMVDPLPQALILTAIVIGFGVTAYMIALLYRIYLEHGTTSIQELFKKE